MGPARAVPALFVLLLASARCVSAVSADEPAKPREPIAPRREERPTVYDGPLVGRWRHAGEFMKIAVVFLPDGRYGWTTAVEGAPPLTENGTFAVADEGATLVLRPTGREEHRFRGSLVEGTLALFGGSLGDAGTSFVLEAGSAKAVAVEARAADAAKVREDDAWRARLPVVRRDELPPHVAVGEVPADPKPDRVFDKPVVFASMQIYFHQAPFQWVLDPTTHTLVEETPGGFAQGGWRNTEKWFLLPTGRAYVKFTNYQRGGKPDAPKVQEYWGRYRLDDGERLVLETDLGENVSAELLDGRRNLLFQGHVVGNVLWEKEALERLQRGGR